MLLDEFTRLEIILQTEKYITKINEEKIVLKALNIKEQSNTDAWET